MAVLDICIDFQKIIFIQLGNVHQAYIIEEITIIVDHIF